MGRDYGAATEILSGVTERQMVIVNPNDSVNEGSRVRATATKAQLDDTAGSAKTDANTEKLQHKLGAEPLPKDPSTENKTRGPSH